MFPFWEQTEQARELGVIDIVAKPAARQNLPGALARLRSVSPLLR